MAHLLADENFRLPVVEALRALGHDIATAQQEGLSGRPDAEVLVAATAASRAVLTHDRDFLRLHRTNQPHAGIVWCTVDPDAGALSVRIDQALGVAGALADQLVRVYRPAAP